MLAALLMAASGTSVGWASELPECVAAYMDTSATWHAFQVAIEDSLEAARAREAEALAALALSVASKERPPAWRDTRVHVAGLVGLAVGLLLTR